MKEIGRIRLPGAEKWAQRVDSLLEASLGRVGLALAAALLFVPAFGVIWAAEGIFSLGRWLQVAVAPALLLSLALLTYAEEHGHADLPGRLALGFGAGLVGTVTLESFLWLAALIGLLPNHPAGTLGQLWVSGNPDRILSVADWEKGYFYHLLLNGACWGMAYVITLEKASWRAGLILGGLLWLGLMVGLPVLLPGKSYFGVGQGPVFPLYTLAALITYGCVVGGLAERWLAEAPDNVGGQGARARENADPSG